MKTIIATSLALILAGCAAQTPPTLSTSDGGNGGFAATSTSHRVGVSEAVREALK